MCHWFYMTTDEIKSFIRGGDDNGYCSQLFCDLESEEIVQ